MRTDTASLTPHRDLVEAAVALGHERALGSYPTERAVFEAVVSRCRRPVVVSAGLLSGLADVYDEALNDEVPF